MRKWTKRAVILVIVAGFLTGVGFAYRQYRYPYGWSHCCDTGMGNVLRQYADSHGGWFPRGESTPEASLSLLYREDPNLWYWLRGKTIPESVVKERLESGKLLSAETCGWHYVVGLRNDDNPRLALLWDKAGLGHNGERCDDGGYTVVFVSGDRERISGKEWDNFSAEQVQLRANVKRKAELKQDKPTSAVNVKSNREE